MAAMVEVVERDEIFRQFGRAFLQQDVSAIYEVVTSDFTWTILEEGVRVLDSPGKISAFFEERRTRFENVRFDEVVYHHAPEATFMTFRMTGTEKATGEVFARIGVERYTFRDGRVAVKDVYYRPMPL